MDKKMIQGLFETNYWVVTNQTKGLTHEDSLLQLPFRGNCLNWVLGHCLVSRESVLKMPMLRAFLVFLIQNSLDVS